MRLYCDCDMTGRFECHPSCIYTGLTCDVCHTIDAESSSNAVCTIVMIFVLSLAMIFVLSLPILLVLSLAMLLVLSLALSYLRFHCVSPPNNPWWILPGPVGDRRYGDSVDIRMQHGRSVHLDESKSAVLHTMIDCVARCIYSMGEGLS